MDNLEKFIKTNRASFDSETPRSELWERLAEELEEEEKNVRMVPLERLWWVAASFSVVVMGLLAFILLNQQPEMQGNQAVSQPALEDISPEVAEAEGYYQSAIYKKVLSLNQYDLQAMDWPSNPKEELETLDAEYQELKAALFEEANPGPVTNAMIENLRTRLQILSTELELLEAYQQKINQSKNTENDEKAI